MNKKQILVLGAGIIVIILIILLTPRYKITQIDANNFIQTEQSSSLYKRSKGTEKLHWDKICLYSGFAGLATGLLIALLKDKKELNG